MVRQETHRKLGYAIQADEEQLRVGLETIQAELNAPTQFKVNFIRIKETILLLLRSDDHVPSRDYDLWGCA
jgi:hypothetical protein